MNKLSESAMKINEYLRDNGMKTQKELIHELNMSIRTVKYSVRRLMEKGVIKSFPNLMDIRSKYYINID